MSEQEKGPRSGQDHAAASTDSENHSTNGPPAQSLDDKHRVELHASGLTDATIEASGIYSAADSQIRSILGWQPKSHSWERGMVIPFRSADGAAQDYARVKLDFPRHKDEKPIKYESPRGAPNRAYFPSGFTISETIIITEGEKKALAATQAGFPTIGLVGVWGWQQKRKRDDNGRAFGCRRLIPDLARIDWKDRCVFIAFDSDATQKPEVQLAEDRLAEALTKAGASVKIACIPPGPDGAKVGLDDFLLAHGPEALHRLIDGAVKAETPSPQVGERDPVSGRFILNPADPLPSARLILNEQFTIQGILTQRFYAGIFWIWRGNRYTPLEEGELRKIIYSFTENALRPKAMADGDTALIPFQPNQSKVGNLIDAMKAIIHLSADVVPPAWIDGNSPDISPRELLACKSGILHIPTRQAIPPTPRLFTTSALTFDYDPSALVPKLWLGFLNQLWPDDPQSINTLQEVFGYGLTGETSQQKMFLLVGPKRSGKGTIGRVLKELVGAANVAGPTTSSLATPFGLQPLIGKTLAIVSDARFSGQPDSSVVLERLLCISGEDTLTIPRKYLGDVTMKLPTRFMFLTNELPRVTDASGAMAGRFIVLLLRRSFYGEEDTELTAKLLTELPGILNWALEGWERLRQRGRFVQPESSRDAIQELADLGSPVAAFIRDCCIIGAGFHADLKVLFEAWGVWCKEHGRDHHGTIQTFGRDLMAAVPGLRRSRPRDGDDRRRGYAGIGLRTDWNQSGPQWSATQPIVDGDAEENGNSAPDGGISGNSDQESQSTMPGSADHRGPKTDEAGQWEG